MSPDEGSSRVWHSHETDYDEAVLATDYLSSHEKEFEINHSIMT